jgi:hypothetical protein
MIRVQLDQEALAAISASGLNRSGDVITDVIMQGGGFGQDSVQVAIAAQCWRMVTSEAAAERDSGAGPWRDGIFPNGAVQSSRPWVCEAVQQGGSA